MEVALKEEKSVYQQSNRERKKKKEREIRGERWEREEKTKRGNGEREEREREREWGKGKSEREKEEERGEERGKEASQLKQTKCILGNGKLTLRLTEMLTVSSVFHAIKAWLTMLSSCAKPWPRYKLIQI